MSYGRGRYNRSPACLYVGNLPDDIRENEIESLFRKYGKILDIDIKRGRNTAGTAYAFIDYQNVHDAEEAIEKRNEYLYHKNRLRVEFTGERRPRRKDGSGGPPTRTNYRVIVTNLPSGCCWQHLKDHMREVGDVGYANIENKKGIVEYLRSDDMMRALDKLDKTELHAYDSTSVIKVRRDDYHSSNGDHYSRRRRPMGDGHSDRRDRSDSYHNYKRDRNYHSNRHRHHSYSVESNHRRSRSRDPSHEARRSRDPSNHSAPSVRSRSASRHSHASNLSRTSNGAPPNDAESYKRDRKSPDNNEEAVEEIRSQEE